MARAQLAWQHIDPFEDSNISAPVLNARDPPIITCISDNRSNRFCVKIKAKIYMVKERHKSWAKHHKARTRNGLNLSTDIYNPIWTKALTFSLPAYAI